MKKMHASASDVETAVDPIMKEVLKVLQQPAVKSEFIKPLLEKLFLRGYKLGYNVKSIQKELHEYRKTNPRKTGSDPDTTNKQ